VLAVNNNDPSREEIPMLYTIHRYPAEWIDRWTMHDGSIATVRPILPQDAPLEAALVEGLSSESRYARFLVGGGRLTDEMLAAYTQIDYVNHMALVVSVARPDGTGQDLIADGRFVVEDGVAEFAMLVADAWQGKGVGRRLFATLVRAARVSGAREVFGEVLSINRRMISLARDAGFRVANVPGDATVCTVRLPLADVEAVMTPFVFA
jgi:acetyltransferase